MAAAVFDEGAFAPCPARFNMAAHTFAAAAGVPDKPALLVVDGPGASGEALGELVAAVGRDGDGVDLDDAHAAIVAARPHRPAVPLETR